MHSRQWASRLRDLGECEVKHGVRLHLVNLYAEPLGNAAVAAKVSTDTKQKLTRRSIGSIAALVLAAILVAERSLLFHASTRDEGRRHSREIDRGAADGQFHRRSG